MPETITISVPITVIDAAMRERIVSLEDERDAVLAVVGPLDGETLAEAVGRVARDRIAELTRERDEAKSRMFALMTERDEEKARRLEADRELELARVEAEAKPNQSAWEAACMLRKERDDAKSLAQGEVTRASRLAIETNTLRRQLDEMVDAHEAMRKERDEARRECNSDFVSRIAGILGASRDETTLSAADRVVCERDTYRIRVRDLESDFCKLSHEIHAAQAELAAGRAVRDEYLDELNEIRHLLGAGPGVTALEAVRQAQAQGEHAETLTALAKARQERNEARAWLSIERDITRELRASLKIPNGVSLTGTVKRLAEEREEARAGLAAHEDLAKKSEERAAFFAARADEARAELARYVAAVDAAIKHASKVLP